MNSKIHNEMAEFAYQNLTKLKPDKEFRSLARSFPSMIQINGLGAAAAFLYSKGKKGGKEGHSGSHGRLYTLINDWTKKKFGQSDSDQADNELIKRITSLDSSQYRIYTNEVMNLCLWIKRFAEGMVDGDE